MTGESRLNPLTLHFDGDLEAAFREERIARSIGPVRLGLGLIAALGLLYLLGLMVLTPDAVERRLVWALILAVPAVSLLALAASFLPAFDELMEPAMAAVFLAIGAVIIAYSSLFPTATVTPTLGTAAVMLVIWFVLSSSALGFVAAAAVALAVTAGWLATELLSGISSDWRLLFFPIAALALATITRRAAETHERLEFVHARDLAASHALLVSERERSTSLLQHVVSGPVLAHLAQHQGTGVSAFPDVTVLVADVVEFSNVIRTAASPDQVVDLLNQVFADFDRLTERHGLEKLKTIGDAYVVAAGLPTARLDHAATIADLALEMRLAVAGRRAPDGQPLRLHAGIATGEVVGGVIGSSQRFSYDIWGEAISGATRLKLRAEPNTIEVAAATRDLLREAYVFEDDLADGGTSYRLVGRA